MIRPGVATITFGLATALFIAGLVLTAAAGQPFSLNELLVPAFYAFAVVGYLIARRRPGNAIAWICLAVGLVWGLESAMFGAIYYGLANPGSVSRPDVLAGIATPLWVPGIFVVLTFLLLLFPDGHLPSPRWKWLAWLISASIASSYVLTVLSEPQTYGYGRPSMDNPFAGVLGPWFDRGGLVADLVELFLILPVFVGIAASTVAIVRRYRRSTGDQRQQLKWLAAAGSVLVPVFVASIFLVDILGETVGLIAGLALVMFPVSIGIAVLRYRLYGIDRVVSRTVSYGMVAGLLAAVYAGIAIGLPQVLPVTLDSSLLVAMATLVIAVLFSPVRTRVQRVVDRRFNRVRYDAQREMDRFAERLRTELDLGGIEAEILDLVGTTMQPVAAGVWLREERR